MYFACVVFFFKQKTAYEMRISDWSSDVCSSDLYGVFDERRHFRASEQPTLVFEQNGVRVGLCICEDIWGADPAASAKAARAELLLNINASPFEAGKTAERRNVFAARVQETGLQIGRAHV